MLEFAVALAGAKIPVEENTDYVIGWGTLALINAGLAQGKNRSGLGWFLLSVFLGPLATFLLLFFDRLPEAAE